jgi:hypothetical protein
MSILEQNVKNMEEKVTETKRKFDELKIKVEQLIKTYRDNALIIPKTDKYNKNDVLKKYLKLLFLKYFPSEENLKTFMKDNEINYIEKNILSTSNYLPLDKLRLIKEIRIERNGFTSGRKSIKGISNIDEINISNLRNKYVIGLYYSPDTIKKLHCFIFQIKKQNDINSIELLMMGSFKFEEENINISEINQLVFLKLLIGEFIN